MVLARCIGALSRPSLNSRFRSEIRGQALSSGQIGRLGEDLAARWLKKQRRKILYRNYRGPHGGEVDIVCRHGATLTFVEVKTRVAPQMGRPADAVTMDKQRLVMRGGAAWLRLLRKPDTPVRCDVVEVILHEGERPTISVIEGAFRLGEQPSS